ncbi:MAG: hypothetical protein PVH56_09415 [Desulfobacterales bacterium]
MGRTPVIAADWETDDSDDRWNMPVAFGVCKIHFFSKMSIKMGAEFQRMPIKPGFGVDPDRDKDDRKFTFEVGFRYFIKWTPDITRHNVR